MNIVQQFEQKQIEQLGGEKKFPDFRAGDTVRVHVKIIEGANERIQAYEGVCIGRCRKALGSTFTVRKISHGEGVERKFQLFSPKLDKIEVTKRGVVRRAKLYYMRKLRGKAARIEERVSFNRTK
jgi:large subunit ribosomal protein L19